MLLSSGVTLNKTEHQEGSTSNVLGEIRRPEVKGECLIKGGKNPTFIEY